MTDLDITLGDFVFTGYETPEEITIGGSQMIAVHQLVGGAKIVNAMGGTPEPLSWSGWFVGENALERALYLDNLRADGGPLIFILGQLSYEVIISKFTAKFQKSYQLPYSITLEVVVADNLQVPLFDIPEFRDIVLADQTTAEGLARAVADNNVIGLVGKIRAAIDKISDFAKASQAEIASVLNPISDVRSAVSDLLTVAENTMQNVTTVGGLIPGNPISKNINILSTQVNAANQTPLLLQLDDTTSRMAKNTENVNAGNKAVTTSGGSLYSISAAEYGDPMAWTAIAQANNITDPQLSGINTIKIPPQPTSNSGVLNA